MSAMTKKTRIGIGLTVGAGILLLPVALAWACIPVATLDVSPVQARPGQEVTVTGRAYGKTNPVLLRFNALDGPVLATMQASEAGLIKGTVVIPADVAPGNYVLVATQEAKAGETTWGIPSRGMVQVVGEGGAPVAGAPVVAPVEGRPAALVEEEPVGAGTLAVVALGTAGVGLFLAAMAALAAGRRRGPAPEAVLTER